MNNYTIIYITSPLRETTDNYTNSSSLQCVLQAEPIRVLVTGAAGQIAYSLLFSIAKGDVFGKDQVRKVLVVLM